MIEAMIVLGRYFKNGLESMSPDPVSALAWLRLARDSGVDQDVLDDMAKLDALLDDEGRQAAEALHQRLRDGCGPEGPEPE